MRPTALLLTFAFASVLLAQTNSASNHNHPASGVIDGAVHPELIPDSVAYRLYFVAVSEMPNPTDEQKARQSAHLAKMGLADADLHSIILVLEDFKVQYTNLVARYNESANAAQRSGDKPDIDGFLLQRDGLVQGTRERLKSLLTPDGVKRLDAHVQAEKQSMKVSSQEGQ